MHCLVGPSIEKARGCPTPIKVEFESPSSLSAQRYCSCGFQTDIQTDPLPNAA